MRLVRHLPGVAVLAFFWQGPGAARAEERQELRQLVEISGFDEPTSYRVTTPDEVRSFTESAELDNAALQEAYRGIREKWQESHKRKETRTVTVNGQAKQIEEEVQGPPFPLKRPAPREVRVLGSFRTAEAAERARQQREERAAARARKATAPERNLTVSTATDYQLKRPERMMAGSRAGSPENGEQAELMDQLIREVATVRARLANEKVRAAAGLKTAPSGPGGTGSSRITRPMGNPTYKFDSK